MLTTVEPCLVASPQATTIGTFADASGVMRKDMRDSAVTTPCRLSGCDGDDELTVRSTSDVARHSPVESPLTVANDEAHTGMGFRFLGDGVSNTSVLADGVYLLSLKVSTAGLTDSDPFYFVLPKGVSPEEAGSATFAFAQQQGIGVGAIQAMIGALKWFAR
mgnify:CR=1 FL=1